MEFFDVVRARRSIRKFQERAVEPGLLRRVLEAVDRAPSAGNLQALRVLIITQARLKRRLAEAIGNQSSLAQAPAVLVFCADPERAAARYGARGQELFCIQDATIACAYAQLAATALGLSSVWLGVAFEPETVQEVLSLGDGLWPIALLPIGYAAEDPPRTPRRDLRELCEELPPSRVRKQAPDSSEFGVRSSEPCARSDADVHGDSEPRTPHSEQMGVFQQPVSDGL